MLVAIAGRRLDLSSPQMPSVGSSLLPKCGVSSTEDDPRSPQNIPKGTEHQDMHGPATINVR